MSSLEATHIHCPYCGESVELLIDCSIPEQQYIEDCFVCCRPIEIQVVVDIDGLPQVVARDENEA
jgi:cysteine-rich CPXCG protein